MQDEKSGCAVFRVRNVLERIPVTMAKGSHLFPYRTQKLSLSAPMVLGWRRPGRVGRCRIPNQKELSKCWALFDLQSGVCNSRGQPQPSTACTWLGEPMAASCGRNEAMGELRGSAYCRSAPNKCWVFSFCPRKQLNIPRAASAKYILYLAR